MTTTNDRPDLPSEGAPDIDKTILVNVNRNKYPVVRPTWALKPGLADRLVVGRNVTLTDCCLYNWARLNTHKAQDPQRSQYNVFRRNRKVAFGELEIIPLTFNISALDEGQRSASRSDCFTPGCNFLHYRLDESMSGSHIHSGQSGDEEKATLPAGYRPPIVQSIY
jgi:hypothetical protein